MQTFWLCFIPLFVAVDAIGVLPMFMSLTEGIAPKVLRRVIVQSVVTAMLVALAFLAIGTAFLNAMGMTVADFMIAGGLLLLVISISDLLTTDKIQRRVDLDSLGAVPLGVPLITGPAVLTTSILLLNEHGLWPTMAAVIANITIAGIVFTLSPWLHRFLGKAGAKTISKITSLLLASLAVMMIRKGLLAFIPQGFSS